MNNDEKWMALAIKQAVKADTEGEVPVGGEIEFLDDGTLFSAFRNRGPIIMTRFFLEVYLNEE